LRTSSAGKCDADTQPYSRRDFRLLPRYSDQSLDSRKPVHSTLITHVPWYTKASGYAALGSVLAFTRNQVKPVALVSTGAGGDDTASSTTLLREPLLPCSCKTYQLLSTSKMTGVTEYSPLDSDQAST